MVRVADVLYIVLSGSPEREIELFAKIVESPSRGLDGDAVEDFERRRTLQEEFDLREIFHFEG